MVINGLCYMSPDKRIFRAPDQKVALAYLNLYRFTADGLELAGQFLCKSSLHCAVQLRTPLSSGQNGTEKQDDHYDISFQHY